MVAVQHRAERVRSGRGGPVPGGPGHALRPADPFLGTDDRYSHAHWLYQHNGGVFLPPWGKIEQWLISVQHDEADIDRLVENFGAFARGVGEG